MIANRIAPTALLPKVKSTRPGFLMLVDHEPRYPARRHGHHTSLVEDLERKLMMAMSEDKEQRRRGSGATFKGSAT